MTAAAGDPAAAFFYQEVRVEILLFGSDIFLSVVIITWLLQWIIPPIVIKVNSIFNSNKFSGLCFLFFVFIRRDKYSDSILRHEFAHYRQQRYFSPMGLALFLFIHYTYLIIKHRSLSAAYQKSIIEKHANDEMKLNKPLPFHINLN